jgi:hypothetical protein
MNAINWIRTVLRFTYSKGKIPEAMTTMFKSLMKLKVVQSFQEIVLNHRCRRHSSTWEGVRRTCLQMTSVSFSRRIQARASRMYGRIEGRGLKHIEVEIPPRMMSLPYFPPMFRPYHTISSLTPSHKRALT